MIKDKVKNIIQEYINKIYGIEKPKEINIETVMEALDSLTL